MKKVAPFNLNLVPFKTDKTGAFDVVNYLTCLIAVKVSANKEVTIELQHADELLESSFKTFEDKKITEKLSKDTFKQYCFDLTGAKKYVRMVFKGFGEGDIKIAGFGDVRDNSLPVDMLEETVTVDTGEGTV